jgi:hypothetical protein
MVIGIPADAAYEEKADAERINPGITGVQPGDMPEIAIDLVAASPACVFLS